MEPIFRLPPDVVMHAVVPGLTEVPDWSHGYLGMDAVQAEAAGQDVLFIVLDTGVDAEHPDLAGQIVETRDFTGSLYGAADVVGHGTHCTGTIVAVAHNEIGGRGIAYRGKAAVGKVLGDSGAGREEWIVQGIRWAREVSRGVKYVVLSMSFGAGQLSERAHAELQAFLTDGGLRVAVAAAGNDGVRGTVGYPAAFDEVLSVGAFDALGNLTAFTSRRGRIDIVGPGAGIVAPVPRRMGSYASMDGTSMATPCIAGVVGCICSADQLDGDSDFSTAEQLRELMIKSASPMTDGSGLRLINPRAFKDLVDNGQPPSPPPASESKLVGSMLGMEVWRPARAGDALSVAFAAPKAMQEGTEVLALMKCLERFGNSSIPTVS